MATQRAKAHQLLVRYRKIRAINGSLIKVDLELIAKGWE